MNIKNKKLSIKGFVAFEEAICVEKRSYFGSLQFLSKLIIIIVTVARAYLRT